MFEKAIICFTASVLFTGSIMAQGIIDVHSHNVPDFYLEALNRHEAALDEGFPIPTWDIDSQLEFMDAAGIGKAVLTMPAPQPYFGDSEECQATIRRYNESCAELKKAYPDRFLFCASLPLPDVDAAIKEAIYALDVLGADGVKLATNSYGQYLGDEELDPLMEVLDERNAVIIIHPHKPVPVNEEFMAAVPLAGYEYPAETTRAVLNMFSRNVLVRYSNLKVIVPHCGSFLPLAIPRLKGILPAMLAKGLMQDIDFEGNLSRLYYDLAGGGSPALIRNMLSITTPDHILYGSDYPYQPAEVLSRNLDNLEKALSEDAELSQYKEMFLWKNAAELFKLK